MLFQAIDKYENERGSLVAINELPFKAKRTFYVKNVPKGQVRGKHAHFRNKQILICISGLISVKLDTGSFVKNVELKEGNGIFVNNLIWDEQTYKTGEDILLSICSTEYDDDDYIRNYDEFKRIIKERRL